MLACVLTLPGAVKCGWSAAAAAQDAAGQDPQKTPQNPPPAAQLQATHALAPPALTIPRLTRAPALEDFLDMKPEGEIALQMAKVTGFVQRNPHDGERVSEETAAYLGYDQKDRKSVV